MALSNTENLRDEIDKQFRLYVDGIKIRTKCNLNDCAVNGEGFFRNFFNLLFGFNLSKDKIESAYNETIDLHDVEGKRCVQVTARNDKPKVETTINHFVNKKRYEHYKELHFIIIDREISFKYDANALLKYGVTIVFHDYTTIFQSLKDKFDSYDKIKPIYDFIISELDQNKLKFDTSDNSANSKTINNSFKPNKELHLVDQILEYFKLFEGFNFIHPRTISRLPIFNSKESYHDSYSHFCLKTSNKSIHELLQKVKVENTVITISDESLKPYEEKLKEIFLVLNNCLIQCICYREKYTEIEHHKIKVKHYDSNCNCLSCQFRNFKIQTLFTDLKSKAIEHSENLDEALAEGYYLCKLGEHIKGWQILKSVAEKSKNQNNSAIHFLSLYNIKQIRNYIDSPWWKSENKQILPKIDEIDLHITINDFSIPVELRDELIKVKEKHYLHWSREIIDEQFESILSTNKLYANGGTSLGTNAINLLLEELSILYAFYSANHIITDDFYTFRQAITKGIEGVLISFTTDKSYEYRFKEFNSSLLSFMFFFLEEKKLEELFNEYKIQSIPIIESEKQSFISTITNFFTFQYATGIWNSIKFNDDISKQDYFSSYRQSLRFIFNNIMLLLSKAELTDEELKPIAKPFVNYLRVAEDFDHNNWAYAIKFFKAKIQIFSSKQIKTIIELKFDDKHHNSGDDILESICDLAFEKANFILTENDKAFFEKLFNRVTTACKKCNRVHNTKQIFASWNIANKTGKQVIKQKAVEYLEGKFDANFYMNAAFKGVFTKDENPNLLKRFIESVVESCSPYDIKQDNGKWKFQNFTGFNFINCLAYLNVDFNQENIQEISKISDYYNWLINYETYDYTNFDLKWLNELFVPYYIKEKLQQIEPLKEKIIKELKDNYDYKLAEFYTKNLIK
ncbi:MAG: SMEK domain-containing protein [Sphingobacteriales bacterium]|nr:MAG: SMEK domain-containing protein [Sphingobacteriales bacterium]